MCKSTKMQQNDQSSNNISDWLPQKGLVRITVPRATTSSLPADGKPRLSLSKLVSIVGAVTALSIASGTF